MRKLSMLVEIFYIINIYVYIDIYDIYVYHHIHLPKDKNCALKIDIFYYILN